MALYRENNNTHSGIRRKHKYMMLLKNAKNVESLIKAVDKCKYDVYLRSTDGTEEFNLKSVISRYVAIGELCKDHGDEFEIFCTSPEDEGHLLKFFCELREDEIEQERKSA